MSEKNTREALAGVLLDLQMRELVDRIKSGTATSADLSVALATVKHMGVGMIPTEGNSAGRLAGALTDSLPFASTGIQH